MIEVDVEKSMKDGIKWYISKNKVILTSGINGALHPVHLLAQFPNTLLTLCIEILQEGYDTRKTSG